MFKAIILENFKAFAERQVIALSPLTLIYGANSSGKSSILQSLLLLKQTMEKHAENTALLTLKGSMIDLGNFQQIVFSHDTTRSVEIALIVKDFDWENATPCNGYGMGFRFSYNTTNNTIGLNSISHYWSNLNNPDFSLTPSLGSRLVRNYHYYPSYFSSDKSNRFYDNFYSSFIENYLDKYISNLSRIKELLTNEQIKASDSRRRVKLYRELNLLCCNIQEIIESDDILLSLMDAKNHSERNNAIQDLMDSFDKLLTHFSDYTIEKYISDIRLRNLYNVAINGILPDEISYDDENDSNISKTDKENGTPFPNLFSWSLDMASRLNNELEDLVYIGPHREPPKRHYISSDTVSNSVGKTGEFMPDMLLADQGLENPINGYLNSLGFPYILKIHRIADTDIRGIFGLQLLDKHSHTQVSLTDVGFGVSQVLPIIVQCLYPVSDQVILVEQPELHLHPKAQAALGSIFVDCIKGEWSKQLIIETHSEHLMLRVQRLIREGRLSCQDVSVLYVLKDQDGSHCLPLRLDENGEFLDEWPDGFFEEGFREMFS